MRNIFLVLRHEFLITIQKPSFWVTTFVLPGFIILLNVGSQLMTRNTFENNAPTLTPGLDMSHVQHPPLLGYVDQADLISLPPSVPGGLLQPFASEEAAQRALESGQIEQYYVVPADFLARGQVYLVSSEFNPLSELDDTLFDFVINYSLTGDEVTALVYTNPTFTIYPKRLAPQETAVDSSSNPFAFFVPFAVMIIFFLVITMSSGFMLQSVSREKENRTAEVLLLSLRPRELMLGKVLGLSLVALLQLSLWAGSGLLAFNRARETLETAASLALPPGFIGWGLAFFILGYLLYASMMGAIGALAPNAREGGQFTFLVLLPLLIPLWFNVFFIESPNGALATAFSLIPFTAPVAMMTRMVATTVPTWQILLSLGGLALLTYGMVLLSARFFRADTLLSSAALHWRRFGALLRKNSPA